MASGGSGRFTSGSSRRLKRESREGRSGGGVFMRNCRVVVCEVTLSDDGIMSLRNQLLGMA